MWWLSFLGEESVTAIHQHDSLGVAMHTPGFPVSGTALMAGSGVTWRSFACNAASLDEGNK
jgi:hypothetical protein